jgi:fatty acid desaturase
MIPKWIQSKFRYDADVKPVFLFSLFFLLDVSFLFSNLPIWLIATYAFISFFPKSMITAWNHHHQHVPTFKSPVLNMFLEVMYAFQTGVLPEGWVLHHNLGHHVNYMKGHIDESAWVNKRGRKLSEFEYTLKVGLLSYVLILRNAINFDSRHFRRFILGMLCTGLVYYLLWTVNPLYSVVLFVIPAIAGLFGTVWYTYKHHAGLDPGVAEEASWNVLDPLSNTLTGNLGYHTAHHISCGVHWSKLPALHEKISSKIPAELYRGPGFPFSLFKKIIDTPKGLKKLKKA